KLPWADTVKVTDGVENVVRMLQPGLPGITFDTRIFQQADFIQTAIHNLTQALILGFILVVAILLLFLFEWRVALIILLTILLPGLTGSFFQPLAISYTLAILASMAVALTVTPAMTLILLNRTRVERRESPVTRWLQRAYTGLLSRIVVRPRSVYAGFLAVTAAAVLLVPQMGSSFFPTFKERDF